MEQEKKEKKRMSDAQLAGVVYRLAYLAWCVPAVVSTLSGPLVGLLQQAFDVVLPHRVEFGIQLELLLVSFAISAGVGVLGVLIGWAVLRRAAGLRGGSGDVQGEALGAEGVEVASARPLADAEFTVVEEQEDTPAAELGRRPIVNQVVGAGLWGTITVPLLPLSLGVIPFVGMLFWAIRGRRRLDARGRCLVGMWLAVWGLVLVGFLGVAFVSGI